MLGLGSGRGGFGVARIEKFGVGIVAVASGGRDRAEGNDLSPYRLSLESGLVIPIVGSVRVRCAVGSAIIAVDAVLARAGSRRDIIAQEGRRTRQVVLGSSPSSGM